MTNRTKKRAVKAMWREYATLAMKYRKNADWGFLTMADASLRAMDELKKRIDLLEAELGSGTVREAFND